MDFGAPEVAGPTLARARALNAAGYLQWVQGNQADAHTLLTEAVRIGRAIAAPATLAFALYYLGAVTNAQQDFPIARALMLRAAELPGAVPPIGPVSRPGGAGRRDPPPRAPRCGGVMRLAPTGAARG